MLNLTPKTLSPSPFLFNSIPIPIPIPQNPNHKFLSQSRPSFKSEYQTERVMNSRPAIPSSDTIAPQAETSAFSPPLSTRNPNPNSVFSTLSAVAKSGLSDIWSKPNEEYRRIISENLPRVERGFGESERRWVVTHFDANRVMAECYLRRDFFDLIDVDSFGSDSSFFLRNAMNALKLDGGLLYVTSTDGYSSCGHRPHQRGMLRVGHTLLPMQSRQTVS